MIQVLKKYKKLIIFIVIISIIIGLSFIKLPYIAYFPGKALSLKNKVEVGYTISNERGMFIVTSVNIMPVYLPILVYGFLNPNVDIKSMLQVHPGLTEDDYKILLEYLMYQSKEVAKIVAMKKVGFDVKYDTEGLLIIGVRRDVPAFGVLKVGDIIISVDNVKIKNTEKLRSILDNRLPDETIKVEILRSGKKDTFEVKIVNIGGRNVLGLYLIPKYTATYPFEVNINISKYIGNSSGLMFALGIINQLIEEDLTRGRMISGTGILDINGDIHRVGGIRQKIFTAQRAGAYCFLVPQENYREVKGKFHGLNIIPVSNITEAMNKLLSIPMPKYRPPNK